MKNNPKKRRPEIMKPGRKQLTPVEKRVVEKTLSANKERWKVLFSLNKYNR